MRLMGSEDEVTAVSVGTTGTGATCFEDPGADENAETEIKAQRSTASLVKRDLENMASGVGDGSCY